MSNILFQCPKCSVGLAADYSQKDNQFACPACNQIIRPAPPDIAFHCMSCGAELCAPRKVRNEAFACPVCEENVRVPPNSTLRCRKCGVCVELDDAYFAELSGSSLDCPECGSLVVVPSILISSMPKTSRAGAAPKPPGPQRTASKTMKLDEMLDNIPQAQSLQEGKCPYCGAPVTQSDQQSYSCKICNRIVRIVRRSVR